jgi:hypothetical protein
MTRLAMLFVTASSLMGVLAGPAFADDDDEEGQHEFALRGVTELGGIIAFDRSTISDLDTTVTRVQVSPFIGYFLAPSFALVGTIDVLYQDVKLGGGSESDTDVAVLVGAGYFLPAGSIYIGPQVQVGYGQLDEENAFIGQGDLLLKIKLGTSALANIGAGYRYSKLFGDAPNDYAIGTIAARIGFSVWF